LTSSFKWLALIAVGVAAAAGVWALRGSEARRVRAQVEAAAADLTAPPGEPDVQRLVRLAGLSKRLAPDVVVEAEPGGPAIRGREAVAGLATQLSGLGGIQAVTLTDVGVTFDDLKTRATVSAVAHVTTASPGQPSRYDGDVVTIELRLVDGAWLISRAASEPALSR
jgi:hypothetical protein